MRSSSRRGGFTLVELLVVIAIIGVLVGLLLPAVQAARESARRLQCSNNLKQMGIGAHSHMSSVGHLPAGGWGWYWIGDPDKGKGREQPGGWMFNLLPYLEQENLYNLQTGKAGSARLDAATLMLQTPLPFLNCPSRRRSKLYAVGTQDARQRKPNFANQHDKCARSDYAANGGDVYTDASHGGNQMLKYYGPDNYSNGISPQAKTEFSAIAAKSNGISFPGSTVTRAHIKDGLSNTFLYGEKYVPIDMYESATNGGDNESCYIGDNGDNVRWTYVVPSQDRVSFNAWENFGSAHFGGMNMAMCDGSVRTINYGIDAATFRYLGNRKDGKAIDGSKL
jgi:prepilin-type N-terminal cleavage/methylation domain-containing protein/prepilin-type processing-associated H-X9-DG protein